MMDRPVRVLTVGMKPAVNEALAQLPSLEVTALTQGAKHATTAGRLAVLPYELRSKMSLRAARGVRDTIAETRPDIVQTYGSRPLAHAVIALAGMRRRPQLFSYRGVTSTPSRLRAEDWFTYLAPTVDAHACESEASMSGLVQGGVPQHKCFVTYNCLTRAPEPVASRAVLQGLGVPRDAFVVAMVANFRRVKGADVLLEAARRLADCPAVHFLLLGEVRDPLVERLARDPEIAPRVTVAGFRSDAMDLAGAADLFVMPSRAEALCVALLEAMSMGVCPVVSDAGGMKEAVRHEVDGVVVPKEDPSALAAVVRSLYFAPERVAAMGESARERFGRMFTGACVAERFEVAYTVRADTTVTAAPRSA